MPSVDRSSKPVSLLSATVGTKSGGLREVKVPVELMAKFMSLAQSNTLRNVETCGVLAGKLVSCGNVLVIIISNILQLVPLLGNLSCSSSHMFSCIPSGNPCVISLTFLESGKWIAQSRIAVIDNLEGFMPWLSLTLYTVVYKSVDPP